MATAKELIQAKATQLGATPPQAPPQRINVSALQSALKGLAASHWLSTQPGYSSVEITRPSPTMFANFDALQATSGRTLSEIGVGFMVRGGVLPGVTCCYFPSGSVFVRVLGTLVLDAEGKPAYTAQTNSLATYNNVGLAVAGLQDDIDLMVELAASILPA